MRRYFVLFIILLLAVNQASAVIFEPNDIEWISDISGTLHKGGTISSGNYTVCLELWTRGRFGACIMTPYTAQYIGYVRKQSANLNLL